MRSSFYFAVPITGTNWGPAEYGRLLQCLSLGSARRDRRPDLENYLAERYGGRPMLFNSGRSALEAALRAIARRVAPKPAATVLTPSFVCRAVPQKIQAAGLTPVFYDAAPDLSPCAASALRSVRPDTVAVIYPYLYGNVPDIEELARFCRTEKIHLIEDCAAAFLLKDGNGCAAGSRGDYSIFSFQEGKTIVAGSGGALIDHTGESATLPHSAEKWSAWEEHRLCLAKLSFVVRKVHRAAGYMLGKLVGELGPSFADRMQEAVRTMGAVDAHLVWQQIARWDALFRRKLEIIERYAANLASCPLLRLPQYRHGRFVGRLFIQYPEPVVERQDDEHYTSDVVTFLRGKGVETQLPYFPAHRLKQFASWSEGSFPCTEKIYRSVIEVPTQAELRDDQIDHVCETLLASVSLVAH